MYAEREEMLRFCREKGFLLFCIDPCCFLFRSKYFQAREDFDGAFRDSMRILEWDGQEANLVEQRFYEYTYGISYLRYLVEWR